MILSLLAAKQYADTKSEMFTGSTSSTPEITAYDVAYIVCLVIFTLIFSYGAARLSYFYNMNTGNSGYAILWSVLAFIFSDLYYPMYSFFLNPQSAKSRNNISIPVSV